MIDGYLYFVYVIIHGDVVIIIRLLFFGKLCSRLNRVDSNCTHKTGRNSRFAVIAYALLSVIITPTVFVSHFYSSYCQITVGGSANYQYIFH